MLQVKFLFFVLCLVVLPIGVNAQNSKIKIRLDNCELDSTSLKRIQDSFNFLLSFYERAFPDKNPEEYYARVLSNEGDFIRYSKQKANYNPIRENTIAFFDHGLNEMILHIELSNFEPVFAHELNHALLFKFCDNTPSWINEGFSELAEDIVFEDSVFRVNYGFFHKVRRAKTYFEDGNHIKRVTELTHQEFYDSNSIRNYSISWAIIAFLYMKNETLLLELMRATCDNQQKIIERYYPGGYPFLEADIQSFFYNFIPE